MIFEDDYFFIGKHAEYLEKLRDVIFYKHVNVYILAPIIGLIENETADLDRLNKLEKKMHSGDYKKYIPQLEYSYKLVMLLNDKNGADENQKIDKAFKLMKPEEVVSDEELFESYVRGGIEILYKKLIEKSDDHLKNLLEFMEEIEDSRDPEVSVEAIKELCELAKN